MRFYKLSFFLTIFILVSVDVAFVILGRFGCLEQNGGEAREVEEDSLLEDALVGRARGGRYMAIIAFVQPARVERRVALEDTPAGAAIHKPQSSLSSSSSITNPSGFHRCYT